ncbi:MAG: NUDIX hydrolase [Candidatus Woesearchaeota archaeon]
MTHAHIGERIILSGCLIINDKKEVLLLYRTDHNHYETPGGKVRLDECNNPDEPTLEDLAKTAQRELYEELGEDLKIEHFDYFDKVEFSIPGGRLAIANKFLVKITGNPRVNEPERFSKFDYLPIEHLEDYPISPDLKLLVPKLNEYARTH